MTVKSYILAMALPFIACTCLTLLSCNKLQPGQGQQTPSQPTPQPDPEPEPAPLEDLFLVDQNIELDLGMKAVFGTSGRISIYSATDDKLVDYIDMADIATVTVREDGIMVPKAQITDATVFNTFMDILSNTSKMKHRIVHYTPVKLNGNVATIRPHSGKLDYGKEYYYTVDEGVFAGYAGFDGKDHSFKTASAPSSSATELRVAKTGKADFRTLQGALGFAMKSSAAITIHLADGLYEEMLYLRDRSNITIKGESRTGTVIAYPNNESYESGSGANTSVRPTLGSAIGKSGGRGIVLVENCDKLVLQDLSIKNTFNELKGQAEAIYFNSGSNAHHLTIENCELHSYQDTFLCKGIVYVHNSLIAGHCDYIWGYPDTCVFEDCEIRTLAAGYIVQARVPSTTKNGFVFINCNLTAAQGVADNSVWLARSAGASDCIDNVVFVGCTMCKGIRTAGWCTDGGKLPNPSAPTATAGWREYKSVYPDGTSATSGRNAYCKILSDSEAAPYLSSASLLK